jgi:hypothetical protein
MRILRGGRPVPAWGWSAVLLLLSGTAAWGEISPEDEDRSEAATDLRDRFHLSGNADLLFLYGERNSRFPGASFKIDNARLYLDVDLAENLKSGQTLLVRDASFYAEWDIARESVLQNTVGSLYVRFDGLGGLEALHLKLGRFLVPFGEEYLRQSEARPENPLLDSSVASPYGWDEGLLLFGPLLGVGVDYYLSLTNGDFGFNQNSTGDLEVAGKLDVHPAPWLLGSVSALRIGRLGNDVQPGVAALEWSGHNPRAFGGASSVPNFQSGLQVPDDPTNRLGRLQAWEADLVFQDPLLGRFRLAAGGVDIRSADDASYNRKLRYVIAEGLLEARIFSGDLDALYFAVRASAIGTGSSEKGYLLGDYAGGSALGYNSRSLGQVSLGLGYRLSPRIVLKGEVTGSEYRLVRGVTPELTDYSKHQNAGGLGVSIAF